MTHNTGAASEKSERRSILDVGRPQCDCGFDEGYSGFTMNAPRPLGTPGSEFSHAEVVEVRPREDASSQHLRALPERMRISSLTDENSRKIESRVSSRPDGAYSGLRVDHGYDQDSLFDNPPGAVTTNYYDLAFAFIKMHRQFDELEARVKAALGVTDLWDLKMNGGQTRCCGSRHS